jgi:hypothetical protein
MRCSECGVTGSGGHGCPGNRISGRNSSADSPRASLVAVGSRGLGGFLGLLVGFISLHLANSARCPVAVIGTDKPTKRIVAAVDGSEEGMTGPALAAGVALRTDKEPQIIHVVKDGSCPASGCGSSTRRRMNGPVLPTQGPPRRTHLAP